MNPSPPRRTGRPKRGLVSLRSLVGGFVLSLMSFYVGVLLGMQSADRACQECLAANPAAAEKQEAAAPISTSDDSSSPVIPDTMNKLFSGMARVDRNDFSAKFDVGVPLDPTFRGNEEVLMLFSDSRALPEKYNGGMPTLSVHDATEHCNTVKLILVEPNVKKTCIALMGQWESYHVHKFMRVGQVGGVNEKLPLRYVSRLTGDKGLQQQIPKKSNTKRADDTVMEYLSTIDTVLDELRPIAEKVAKDNTIIVMVCNHGQSELLMNFACSAHARGLDISQVLVFATDTETKDLAEGLGLTAFYDHTNYEKVSKKAARVYADPTFGAMMMAKVYCVHMINYLGYDLLFQDVDIVWYRNPLEYFQDQSSPYYDFDMYFQDDGAHSLRYAPYSPNTGFYFVRHNEKTEYFFHALLMSSNIILGSGSHQNALSAVLNEHVSFRGVRVKILSRELDEFPGGFHYHRRKQFMRDMIAGKVKPYMFHMSWTTNKNNKKLYFEQMGDWYVKHECVGGTVEKILTGGATDLQKACCSAEPIITCHYRDKPSKIPCKDSPPIDKGKKSFW